MTDGADPSIWVVIPTYWGPREGSPFDHPTPLDGESTLPRLLETLVRQSATPPFAVLVLLASVDPEAAAPASQIVAEIGAAYRDAYPLFIADHRAQLALSAALKRHDLDPSGLDLSSYAGIRNLQLLIPTALGAELIVALDDDELVSPMHVGRAHQTASVLAAGNLPFGIAGPYLNPGGSPFLPETASPAHLFAEKSFFMNQAIRQLLDDDDPFPRTPLALGGNMVFPRSLARRIGFDPCITRGEDIDYLINALLAGYHFYFDRLLAIEHRPPRHYESSAYAKLRHDVFRFTYQREKLRLAGFAPQAFDPYPGRLLRPDLLDHARMALTSEFPADGDERWGSPDSILESAQAYAETQAPKYVEFARGWPAVVETLATAESANAIRRSLVPVSR